VFKRKSVFYHNIHYCQTLTFVCALLATFTSVLNTKFKSANIKFEVSTSLKDRKQYKFTLIKIKGDKMIFNIQSTILRAAKLINHSGCITATQVQEILLLWSFT